MRFFTFHIGDWLSGTRYISSIHRAYYFELLMAYYTKEHPLPYQICKSIANAMQVDMQVDMQTVMQEVLSEFFEKTDTGEYRHDRCDEVIAEFYSISEKRRAASAKRWKSKENKKSDNTSAMQMDMQMDMQNESKSNAIHNPLTNYPLTNTDITNSETQVNAQITKPAPRRKSSTCTVSKPDEVDDQLWSDWVSHRKAKKATISKTVIDGLRKWESAGYSLADVMRIQIENGWQGFKPEWVESKTKHNGSSKEMTQEERIACNYDCSNIWPDWNERYPNAK